MPEKVAQSFLPYYRSRSYPFMGLLWPRCPTVNVTQNNSSLYHYVVKIKLFQVPFAVFTSWLSVAVSGWCPEMKLPSIASSSTRNQRRSSRATSIMRNCLIYGRRSIVMSPITRYFWWVMVTATLLVISEESIRSYRYCSSVHLHHEG